MPATSQPAAFGLALGDALRSIAKLLLAIALLAQLSTDAASGSRHFGGDGEVLGHTATRVAKFSAIFLPLMFLAALNGLEHAPFSNRESLGRLSFSLAMIARRRPAVRLFRRKSPLMQRLVRAGRARSWIVKLHGIWFLALVAAPLAACGIRRRGLFHGGRLLFRATSDTLFLGLGAAVLYGMLALWVQVQRSRLTRAGTRRPATVGRRRARKPGARVRCRCAVPRGSTSSPSASRRDRCSTCSSPCCCSRASGGSGRTQFRRSPRLAHTRSGARRRSPARRSSGRLTVDHLVLARPGRWPSPLWRFATSAPCWTSCCCSASR